LTGGGGVWSPQHRPSALSPGPFLEVFMRDLVRIAVVAVVAIVVVKKLAPKLGQPGQQLASML